ncbi:S-adenosyl-L-methionine-dependent methyltransferase [Fomitopsis serialis]|uniref:S-adenosyl-L-methionine-dependent methyltransferase n=1 Tax=Fomitopsis serialis TaxID=139415 RepID=UPI00200889AA|nr:S-adenosyl-L-methionine-dependent methyltransferase [Neoantrodia serialis]KAH9919110.1 S-adenosyl-L-methionine-dependent methyltransferase [Neoantrodia serialis]
MIPTPDLSHLTKQDYDHVYEPAEDTFILLDALEQDAEELRVSYPRLCLEIGSGSGCVSSFIGAILGTSTILCLATDINPHACRCTRLTGRQNKTPIDVVNASLASPLVQRLRHAVDVLIFNPPYVPTYADEADDAQQGADIQGAWAGGEIGMQVTDVLLDQVEDLLSPIGRFYLVAVKQNDVPAIRQRMLDTYRLSSEVVLERRAGGEYLFVVRFSR